MSRRPLLALLLLLSTAATTAQAQQRRSVDEPARAAPQEDALRAAFREPPTSARPRTWWHWLNGNVTEEGVVKDLAWMKRAGLGGVQNFDASLGTPQIVAKRLAYMTPGWKSAFAKATETAGRLGLEFAIAASPGWSETGGPWVPPSDGMKKLVWSTMDVRGGRRLDAAPPPPPIVTGPFGTSPYADALGPIAGDVKASPTAGGTIAVLAVPIDSPRGPAPEMSAPGTPLASKALVDADERTTATVPLAAGADPTLVATYATSRAIRGATLFVPNAVPPFGQPKYLPVLEAQTRGSWRRVATLPLGNVPTTVAFAPVASRSFRVRFAANDQPFAGIAPPAPGAVVVDVFPDRSANGLPVATFTLAEEPRIDRFEAKAGFATVPDYYALTTTAGDAGAVDPARVVDLTSRLRNDGTLDWTPPKGRWRVLRLGWSLLGTTNHPATPEATGLEVDKYDGAAVRRYLDRYLGTYGIRDRATSGVGALVTDSIEAGDANWTPRMLEQFRRLRGYDPTPWLPTLTGIVVGSRARSDAFLYDWRRTLADLLASEHYGTVAAVARSSGLVLYGEALEDKRPQLGDDLAMRAHADVPMGAMWAFGDEGPRITLVGDLLGAASVAHVQGRRYVAAESFTSAFAPWAFGPAELKRVADLEFALGVNRPVIHTSPHSPPDDKVPGLGLAIFGQSFDRHETWAEMARPWVDYLARTGFMLQQGRHVADVAYFVGEEAPVTQLYADGRVSLLPTTNGFDLIGADALAGSLTVKSGRIVSPSGADYAALYLGGTSSRMSLATLRRISALAEAGATIVGMAPTGSPSLADDATEFAGLIRRLWQGGDSTRVGMGQVIHANDLGIGLARAGVVADVAINTSHSADVLFQHRSLEDGSHVYFLHNRSGRAIETNARFRVAGRRAEIWHAETGDAESVPSTSLEGATVVPVSLPARGSTIVVFPAAGRSTAPAANAQTRRVVAIDRGWSLAFQAGRGAPAKLAMDRLSPLNESSVPGVRYFSGIATYRATFTLPKNERQPLAIDLGSIGDVAEVRINGVLVGTSWHAPYRLQLGEAVRPGKNTIEVRVADLWANRLIGDAQPNAAKVAFVAGPTYRPDAPLRPSGLIGPVVVLGSGPSSR